MEFWVYPGFQNYVFGLGIGFALGMVAMLILIIFAMYQVLEGGKKNLKSQDSPNL